MKTFQLNHSQNELSTILGSIHKQSCRGVVSLLLALSSQVMFADTGNTLVLNDTHRNDIQDSGEPGLAGAVATHPVVSGLRPISKKQAIKLGAYARKLRVQPEGSPERVMAWSMINVSCQERALALQYALSLATNPLSDEPPVMREADITVDGIQKMIRKHAFDSALIQITGPLRAERTMISPMGTALELKPDQLPPIAEWSYHHAVVINVEGELMVLDLSVGDEPLTIDEWASGFVPSNIKCQLLDFDEYWKVWVYWMAVTSGWNTESLSKPCECACAITPMFAGRPDQDPLYDQLRWAPSVLRDQTDGFRTLLLESYGVEPKESEIPYYTSVYTPRPSVNSVPFESLGVNEQLLPGQYIQGNYGGKTLVLQNDGNLVYCESFNTPDQRILWSSNTAGKKVKNCILQNDGNLVLYGENGKPVWASNTAGEIRNDYRLRINQEYGRLAIYTYQAVWASNTTVSGMPEVIDNSNREMLYHDGDFLPGQTITSDNKYFSLTFQSDGNIVLYQGKNDPKKAIWSTKTVGKKASNAYISSDGDVILGGEDGILWHTKTAGVQEKGCQSDLHLTVQNDGNLVLYKSTDIWCGWDLH